MLGTWCPDMMTSLPFSLSLLCVSPSLCASSLSFPGPRAPKRSPFAVPRTGFLSLSHPLIFSCGPIPLYDPL
jgi:hypothetical protein